MQAVETKAGFSENVLDELAGATAGQRRPTLEKHVLLPTLPYTPYLVALRAAQGRANPSLVSRDGWHGK